MLSFFTPKIFSCLCAGLSLPLVGGVVYITWPTEVQTMLLVSSEPVADTPTTALKFGKDQNFKCKFADKVDEDCSIEVFTVEATKNWANLSDLNKKAATGTVTAVTADNLKAADNLFKVSISSEIINSVDWRVNSQKLEIIPNSKNKNANEANKKYASLTPVMSYGAKTAKAKNSLFLAKASELIGDSSGVLTNVASSSHKCVLGDSDVTKTENQKACTVKTINASQTSASDSSTYTNLSFSNTSAPTEATTITKNNFYLVEFTDALTDKEMKNNEVFYLSTTDTPTKKVRFSPSYQAALTGATNSQKLFILS